MKPTRHLRLSASVLVLTAIPGVPPAAAQQSQNTLPPVVVEQQAATPAQPKPNKPSPSPQSASPSAPKADTVSSPAPLAYDDAPAWTQPKPPLLTIGATGLAVPAATTRLTSQSIAPDLINTSDSASAISRAPGVSVYQGGGVSGLPVMNGLADDRIKVQINGFSPTSMCANHMNPPLSYVDPSQIAKVEVLTGVTPVSKGGDSIAGTIVVETNPPHFTAPGEPVHTAGSLGAFYRSNGDGVGVNASAHAATDTVSVDYTGAWTRSGNYEDGSGDEVEATEYDAQNHALKLSFKNGADVFTLSGGLQYIPYQGFVNQRMDMVENQSWFVNGRYLAALGWAKLEAKAYYQAVDHEMNFLDDKKFSRDPVRDMPMLTEGNDAGYSIALEIPVSQIDVVRVGNEFHHTKLDEYWPAVTAGVSMMGPNTYVLLNGATRDRLGTYLEWERQWDPAVSTLFGIRNDMVWMDTGDVQGYNDALPGMGGGMGGGMGMGMGGMGMMNAAVYAADAAAFNARDRQRTDANFDATALLRYETDGVSIYEIGYAMKTRSPNFYERYAWSRASQMALNMVTWFGDGNGYTGNLDIDPEHAHTVSVTAGWHAPDKSWGFKITPYYTYVDDYIGVRKFGDQMMAGFVNLEFVNHDAELYGVNVSGHMPLASDPVYGDFALTGVAAYVHGENAHTGISLYHMMPFNTQIALTHRLGGWSSAIELDLVAGKHNVDTVREELETDAYALVNVRTSYEIDNWRFDLGVTNVFDTYFEHPLAGHNMEEAIRGLPKSNVAGTGRSINVGATVRF